MFEEIKNINTSQNDIRNFSITIGVLLLAIACFLVLKENNSFQILLYISASFIGLGLLYPIILKPIYLLWMIFAVILGWIMTRVILSMVFYFIISPIGLLTRLIGEDFLELKKSSDNKSYWNIRNSKTELNQDYEKQF